MRTSFEISVFVILVMAFSVFPTDAQTPSPTDRHSEKAHSDPDIPRILLTAEEKAWLRKHDTVRVGIPFKFPPLMFTEDNNIRGIFPDYLNLFTERVGIRFEITDTPIFETIEQIKNRRIDMSPTHVKIGRNPYMNLTEPFFYLNWIIVNRLSAPFYRNVKDLAGVRVSVVRNAPICQRMINDYPEVEIHQYDNMTEALESVSTGKTDAFIGVLQIIGYMIQKQRLANLKIAGTAGIEDDFLSFAVRGDYPELTGILNKAIRSVTQMEHGEIFKKWMPVRYESTTNWYLIFAWGFGIGGVLMMIIGITLIWNRRLAREINTRRQIEDALKLAKEQAEAANSAKSEFLANMSHELRTPMNAVIGFGDLLYSLITDVKQRSYLNAIRSGGKSLLTLINDILDLSKIEAGKMKFRPEPIRLRSIFEEIRHIFSLKISEKNLEFIVEISDQIPETLMFDEIRLRQILFNLVGNAVKFTEKGEIKISAKPLPETERGESRQRAETPGAGGLGLMIAVEDSGIGISPESHGRIFDAFRQERQKYGGTGLGLTITKRLVEMMNGDIIVKSTPGKGSIFEITFRDVAVCESSPISDSTVIGDFENIVFENALILIADDIFSNRELIKAFFEGTRIRIIEAENGERAIFLSEQYEPDVILMDIRMPVTDGYEAARQIKSREKLRASDPSSDGKSVTIIATTASALSEEREKIMGSGLFDGFLAKPVRKSDLFRELSRFVETEKREENSKKISEVTETDILPPGIVGKLENEYMSLWEEVCETRVFEGIEKFAEKIRSAGEECFSQQLIGYGQELITHARNFDILKIKTLLYSYPKLIGNIRAMDERKSDERNSRETSQYSDC